MVLLRQFLENHLTFSYIYQLSNPLDDHGQLDKYKLGVKALVCTYQLNSKLNYDKFCGKIPIDISWSQLNKYSLEQIKSDALELRNTEFKFSKIKNKFSRFISDPKNNNWKEGNRWILTKLGFKDSVCSIYDFLSDYVHGNFFAIEEVAFLNFPQDLKFLRVLINSILVNKLLYFAKLYLVVSNNKIVFPVSKNDDCPSEYFEIIRRYYNFERADTHLIMSEHLENIPIKFS